MKDIAAGALIPMMMIGDELNLFESLYKLGPITSENFSKEIQFRNLSFELITCENIKFDKYVDEIALIKISQVEDIFIGWFFSITDELNLYSNKIYEVTLKSCSNEN